MGQLPVRSVADDMAQREKAEAFVTGIVMPDGFAPVAIVAGYDPRFMVQFFDKEIIKDEAKPPVATEWTRMSKVRFEAHCRGFNAWAFAAAARRRWPQAKVYNCQCTCCGDWLNLVSETEMAMYPLPEARV